MSAPNQDKGVEHQFMELHSRLMTIFDGDMIKADIWMTHPNPLLGDIAPLEMLRRGQYERLIKFMDERHPTGSDDE